MRKSKSQSQEFAYLLQNFFVKRLMQQRNASPRTIASYRDTFKLFFESERVNNFETVFRFRLV